MGCRTFRCPIADEAVWQTRVGYRRRHTSTVHLEAGALGQCQGRCQDPHQVVEEGEKPDLASGAMIRSRFQREIFSLQQRLGSGAGADLSRVSAAMTAFAPPFDDGHTT